jgi:hypothetical protein
MDSKLQRERAILLAGLIIATASVRDKPERLARFGGDYLMNMM